MFSNESSFYCLLSNTTTAIKIVTIKAFYHTFYRKQRLFEHTDVLLTPVTQVDWKSSSQPDKV
jgi:hypothetical protein